MKWLRGKVRIQTSLLMVTFVITVPVYTCRRGANICHYKLSDTCRVGYCTVKAFTLLRLNLRLIF